MKRFLPLLLTMCFLVPCANAQEQVQVTEPEIHKMANGLQIQSYDTRILRDDLAQMLGVWMWKIRLSTLEKGKSVDVKLELRSPGEKPKPFGGFGESSFEKGDYVFGIQPTGGDSIFIDDSPKIRLYSRGGSMGDSHVIDNPFRNLGGPSFPWEPSVRADGSILLIRFSPSGKDDDLKNSELVVVTSLQSPPPKAK